MLPPSSKHAMPPRSFDARRPLTAEVTGNRQYEETQAKSNSTCIWKGLSTGTGRSLKRKLPLFNRHRPRSMAGWLARRQKWLARGPHRGPDML